MGGNEGGVARFAVLFHCDQAEPCERLVHYNGWRPLVRTVKAAQRVREAGLLEFVVQCGDFRIIEIGIADGCENREDCVMRGRRAGGESRAVKEHARGTLAALGNSGSDAGTAGKACEIDAAIVDGETGASVLEDGLRGVGFHFPGAVA